MLGIVAAGRGMLTRNEAPNVKRLAMYAMESHCTLSSTPRALPHCIKLSSNQLAFALLSPPITKPRRWRIYGTLRMARRTCRVPRHATATSFQVLVFHDIVLTQVGSSGWYLHVHSVTHAPSVPDTVRHSSSSHAISKAASFALLWRPELRHIVGRRLALEGTPHLTTS